MRHKDNYTCIVFFRDGATTPKKWTYVHALNGFERFLSQKYSQWWYFNVYNRRTGDYLTRFYFGAPVPKFID